MSLHYPAISEGATIGLVSPSSSIDQQTIDNSIAYFEKNGFKVKVGKHCLKKEMMVAGSDSERAEDIMMFFKDSQVGAIVATKGGVGSIRALPLLDFNIMKSDPKPMIGFSDSTAIQLGIYAKIGLTSYTGFTGSDCSHGALDSLVETTLTRCFRKENYRINQGVSVNSGTVTAPLIGGNLMSLINLMGTEYQPDYSGKILFIEDVSLEPYLIEGMLAQLYISGILSEIAGLIIGEFIDCEAKQFSGQPKISDLIDNWCRKINVPCIKGFPYGHMDSRCVLPIGITAILDAENCSLDITFN